MYLEWVGDSISFHRQNRHNKNITLMIIRSFHLQSKFTVSKNMITGLVKPNASVVLLKTETWGHSRGKRSLLQRWRKPRKWWRDRPAEGDEKPSVMIHFKDAAFDDGHVSVPHNLVPEGKRNRRHEKVITLLMSKAEEALWVLKQTLIVKLGGKWSNLCVKGSVRGAFLWISLC